MTFSQHQRELLSTLLLVWLVRFTSAGKDDNNEAKPGKDLLKELAQDLTVSEKTSPALRAGLAAIFNNLLSEKMGDEKLKAKLDKYPRPENVKGLRTLKVNPSI